MKKLFNEPIVKFLTFGFFLYLGWLAVYEWWIHPMEWVDKIVINNTLVISQKFLGWMGYEASLGGDRMIQVKGTPGLFLGDSCNGISLFALFSIFVIAFPGKIIYKIFFIPIGIGVIHLLNVLRIVALSVIETYSYEWTEFNHTYTFTILIYAVIFGMWLLWINKFSGLSAKMDGLRLSAEKINY